MRWQRPQDRDPSLKPGTYVLATKYADGDPRDHFAVGFYAETIEYPSETRHIVNDDQGFPIRANGFRRVARLSRRRGAAIVRNISRIEKSEYSVWHWYWAPLRELDA